MTSTPQRTIAVTAVFAALIIASGLISIPAPGGVPIVLQNVFCVLAGLILGPKRGTFAVVVFLALGVIGLPVLAGGRTVLAAVAGPTVGYLVGYLLSPMMAGLLSRPVIRSSNKIALTIGIAVVCFLTIVMQYACGVVGLMIVNDLDAMKAITMQFTFVPGAIIKTIVISIVTVAVLRALPGLRPDQQPAHHAAPVANA